MAKLVCHNIWERLEYHYEGVKINPSEIEFIEFDDGRIYGAFVKTYHTSYMDMGRRYDVQTEELLIKIEVVTGVYIDVPLNNELLQYVKSVIFY